MAKMVKKHGKLLGKSQKSRQIKCGPEDHYTV